MNNILKIVSIADIHMGVLDPEYMYNKLMEEFVMRVDRIDFDVLAICGDIFDSKTMANNPTISYTLLLISNIVEMCKRKNATLVLLYGTESHDAGQFPLFYQYLQDPLVDIRIVEDIKFEIIKGMKVLCIPEKYGVNIDSYLQFLYGSGEYDMCLMHGTIKGSIFGAEMEKLDSNHAPVFSINNFSNCTGLVLAGHVHVPGCFNEYMYYNGSPLRFRFGEEETKGFMITVFNPLERRHYTELIPIDSYIYTTINIDHLMKEDPKVIIDHIKKIKYDEGIDFIRVQFNKPNENMNIVFNYFRNNGNVKIMDLQKGKDTQQKVDIAVEERMNEFSFLFDPAINDYDKFTMYINHCEGYEFITTDELIKLLEGAI